MQVPLPLIPHLALALQEEVSRLEEIAKVCGDDWPGDFDPNDIRMLETMKKSLEDGNVNWGVQQGAEMSEGWLCRPTSYAAFMGKSVRFTMALIPGYVQRHLDQIGEADYNLLIHFYCEFRLKEGLVHISNAEIYLDKTAIAQNIKRWAADALMGIERFPERE